jgi:hypothetical protein
MKLAVVDLPEPGMPSTKISLVARTVVYRGFGAGTIFQAGGMRARSVGVGGRGSLGNPVKLLRQSGYGSGVPAAEQPVAR